MYLTIILILPRQYYGSFHPKLPTEHWAEESWYQECTQNYCILKGHLVLLTMSLRLEVHFAILYGRAAFQIRRQNRCSGMPGVCVCVFACVRASACMHSDCLQPLKSKHIFFLDLWFSQGRKMCESRKRCSYFKELQMGYGSSLAGSKAQVFVFQIQSITKALGPKVVPWSM